MMLKYACVVSIFLSLINLSVSQLYWLIPAVPYTKEVIDTRFYLHTKNRISSYEVSAYNVTSLRNYPFDPKKKTKIITHGFFQNGQRQWLMDMTVALLKYGDFNIFTVDWGKGSLAPFDTALANTEIVGGEVAFFINTLIQEFGLNPADIHCIGHSMGSYVCGYTGQGVNKLSRISALDLGPRSVNATKESDKLDKYDAIFVDAIHTDNIILGDPKPIGHIDIQANGGYFQEGCKDIIKNLLDPNNNLEDAIPDYVINEIFCSHFKSIIYFIESIQNQTCQFVAYECPSYDLFKKGECASCGDDNSKCVLLGIRADEYPEESRNRSKNFFYIETAGKTPYCVQHYVVNISIGVSKQGEPSPGGFLTFEVIGDNGRFTGAFQIEAADQEQIKKSLFVDPVDVGKISSVKLTWKSKALLLGLVPIPTYYPLEVIAVKVAPLSHYPESVRASLEVIACLTSDRSPTTIKTGETKEFPVMANCAL